VSDYESDAVQYMEAGDMPPPAAPPLPARSNTDLNLSVLRRHLPSIRSIVSIAANAVVYNFSPSGNNWEKSGVEGTLFVCEQEPVLIAGHPMPRACVFVLNRRGLNNVVVELCQASICQKDGDLIVFSVESNTATPDSDGEAGSDAKVIGLWLHADEENTREVNAAIIADAWGKSRLVAGQGSADPGAQREADVGDSRQPSISDLFAQGSGHSR
jgi:hypothetical protein